MLSKDDFEFMVLCSLRYTLGRRSYVVGWFKDIVAQYKTLLSTETLKLVIKEVSEKDDLGMQQDIMCWGEVVDLCNREIQRRLTE